MMEKPFHLAIVVGRFQMLHAGHGEMIDLALTLAARTAVLIGSAQEAGTEKNPLSYAQREACLRQLYGDRVEVYPLPD
ncbi:MAG: adenylyltransferase/cytidyltransferase family protein, partial [bacterium]